MVCCAAVEPAQAKRVDPQKFLERQQREMVLSASRAEHRRQWRDYQTAGSAFGTLSDASWELAMQVEERLSQVDAARETLAENGLATTVVAVPCLELFWQQDATYRKAVLGSGPRIVIEAALRQPWDRLLNEGDGFVGMDDFGASAPIADIYEHFNITSSAVAKLAIDLTD